MLASSGRKTPWLQSGGSKLSAAPGASRDERGSRISHQCPEGPGRHRPLCEVCAKEVSPTEATITVCSKVVHHMCAETHFARCRECRPRPRPPTPDRPVHQNHGCKASQIGCEGGADPEGRKARLSRAPWLLDEKGAESTSEDGFVGDGDSCGAVIESNVPRCSWLCQNCRSVTCLDAHGHEDDLHICCSCYARYLGVPEEPSSVSCGTSKGNSHNWQKERRLWELSNFTTWPASLRASAKVSRLAESRARGKGVITIVKCIKNRRNWSYEAEAEASDRSSSVNSVGVLSSLAPRTELRAACWSQLFGAAKAVKSDAFHGGNGTVRLAEFEQEGTSPPVMLQHSNVDLWLMQVPEASGASARPISRRPRCHTCGREVAPREARHTRCGHVVHRDSEGCECKRVHFRNCAECLRPQPGPEPLPNHLQAHESSEQSGLSGGAFQSDGSYVGNGAARLASIGAARQAAVASTVSSQAHETSPASGPLKVEVPAAPRFVDAYVSTDEFRVPQAGQEVFAAYLDTEEERVSSLRAIERLRCSLAQCTGPRLGSEAYDNTENHHAEENRAVEVQMSECSDDMLRAPLTRTGIVHQYRQ